MLPDLFLLSYQLKIFVNHQPQHTIIVGQIRTGFI